MAKIAICIPSRDQWEMGFGFSLVEMCLYFQRECPEHSIRLFVGRDTLLDRNREWLADRAIESGCSHILWLDTDMRFPKDALQGLLKRGKPVVGANYMRKTFEPVSPVSWRSGELVFTAEGDDFLEPVDFTGFGVMLIDVEVIKKLSKPYFMMGYNPNSGQHVGEDVYFFNKVRKAGYEVLIDHGLSNQVGHIGQFEFMPSLAWAVEELTNGEVEQQAAE